MNDRTRSRLVLAASLLGALTLWPGCAAVMATKQPPKRDMAKLNRGVPRTHVIAELGTPVWSDQSDGRDVDVFSFKQGYAKPTKAARALVHGAADVATFGLWEVVGVPAESLADGTDVQLEVHYDEQQTVDRVVVIKGDKVVRPSKFFTRQKPTDQSMDHIESSPVTTAANNSKPAKRHKR